MAREDKGKSMGSYDDMPPSKQPGDEPTSLAARRARLRGSLAKAALPEEAFAGGNTGDDPVPAEEAVEPNPVPSAFQHLHRPGETGAGHLPEMPPPPAPADAGPQSTLTSVMDSLFPPVLPNPGYGANAVTPAAAPAAPPPAPIPPAPAAEIEQQLLPAVPETVSHTVQQASLPPELLAMIAHIDESTNACATNLAVLQVTAQSPPPAIPAAVTELLTNVDSAMNACALNLAALQRIADEQTEVMKNLSDTLKNQTLYEIGLNLNSLTESLSAALEPMKAVGELVPAIDQLVAAMEAKASVDDKYSPDQLVMNLADQLSTGAIDPWTFKCAYMAIFPADHPADLLRRLVELLGTQRLSGDLFRAAYEAVQAAEPPPRSTISVRQVNAATAGGDEPGGGGNAVPFDDPETRAQLEALRAANEEMRKAIEERENEFEQLLAAKDQELAEAQDMLNSRYEEFNTRYAELTEALNKREDEYSNLLENKDMELTEKESELSLLRHQMEELRSQTEDMVKELQVQMTDIRIAKEAANQNPTTPPKPPTTGSFFDTAPPAKPSSLFDAAPAVPEKPFFAADPAPAPVQPAPAPQPAPPPTPAPPPAQPVQPQPVQPQSVAQQASTQQMNRPASMPAAAPTTPFTSGAGSYGSGVRAQVFEVIVRQALAGAPWREICAGPMQVNNITPEEVEAEVKRRQAMLNK